LVLTALRFELPLSVAGDEASSGQGLLSVPSSRAFRLITSLATCLRGGTRHLRDGDAFPWPDGVRRPEIGRSRWGMRGHAGVIMRTVLQGKYLSQDQLRVPGVLNFGFIRKI
jgi:hypothetical protein